MAASTSLPHDFHRTRRPGQSDQGRSRHPRSLRHEHLRRQHVRLGRHAASLHRQPAGDDAVADFQWRHGRSQWRHPRDHQRRAGRQWQRRHRDSQQRHALGERSDLPSQRPDHGDLPGRGASLHRRRQQCHRLPQWHKQHGVWRQRGRGHHRLEHDLRGRLGRSGEPGECQRSRGGEPGRGDLFGRAESQWPEQRARGVDHPLRKLQQSPRALFPHRRRELCRARPALRRSQRPRRLWQPHAQRHRLRKRFRETGRRHAHAQRGHGGLFRPSHGRGIAARNRHERSGRHLCLETLPKLGDLQIRCRHPHVHGPAGFRLRHLWRRRRIRRKSHGRNIGPACRR
jgi:hypothetical protein